MSITPTSVFQSLTPESRMMLLRRYQPTLQSADYIPDELADLEISKTQHNELAEVLHKVSILGSEEVSFVVRNFLSELGWSHEEFQHSHSARDRACSLLSISADAFEDAIAIFNGNRLWWREKRESGFRLPNHDLTLDELDLPDGPLNQETILYGRIKRVLDEYMAGKTLIKVLVNRRSSQGLMTEAKEIMQFSISFGEDPVEVEINDDGNERKLSLSFLSRIAVLIDLNDGTLFVGCDSQSRKLRAGLAMVFMQDLFGKGGEPLNLPALSVMPEALMERPQFVFEPRDRLLDVRVSDLLYRQFNAPPEIVRSISSTSSDVSLYDTPDMASASKNMRIYRAKIEFLFKSHSRKKEPIKKTVTLSNPSGLAYGKTFPQQRVVINRVLYGAGLINHFSEPSASASLYDLYRFRAPQHVEEVRSSWPASMLKAVVQAGILSDGPAAETAWCDICGETHDLVEDDLDSEHRCLANCPHERQVVSDRSLCTYVLNQSGMVSWITKALKIDQIKAQLVCNDCWFLGMRRFCSDRGEHGVFVTLDWQKADMVLAIGHFLDIRPTLKRGVIITTGHDANPSGLRKEWSVVPLAAIASLREDDLSIEIDAMEAVVLGKPLKVKHASKEAWNAFFRKYSETRTGLGHYEEADRMLADYPELCPVRRVQLAKRLQKEFPSDFPK